MSREAYLAKLLQEELDRRFLTVKETHANDISVTQAEIDRRFADLKEMLNERNRTQNEAIKLANEAAEKRFEGVNEFRKALTDQTATFIPRSEMQALLNIASDNVKRVSEQVTALELRVSTKLEQLGGRQENTHDNEAVRRINIALILQALAIIAAFGGIIVLAFHP